MNGKLGRASVGVQQRLSNNHSKPVFAGPTASEDTPSNPFA
jgi:hypothetical protein